MRSNKRNRHSGIDQAACRADVLAALEKHGPLSSRELAARLGVEVADVGTALISLAVHLRVEAVHNVPGSTCPLYRTSGSCRLSSGTDPAA